MKIRPFESGVVPCGQRTGRHDEAKCHFSKFLRGRLKTAVVVIIIIIIIISTTFLTDVQIRNKETFIITL
jgi:hypothetical protein